VSEIAAHRVKDVRDELKEGEQIMVKVINVDPSGKIRLSRKALLAPEGAEAGAGAATAGAGDQGSGPSEGGGPRRDRRR
jgi:polyribonucleotide nucleotidyltransferase